MNITYDDRSFVLDGKRIWLHAGEIHYFRLPMEEWKPALLRAKRAGLNAVSTYVAWNFHEQREGEPDFTGGRDLGRYIDLIGELGMFAMVRPGPYICSEWDGGGLPAWLNAKPVRRFREDDPVYMNAVERWFDALLPIVAARQVTRGGPVITVQNENEYPGGWDESMRRYIRKLSGMFLKHGIDVPVLACNVHAASPAAIQINSTTVEADQFIDPGMILTYNHHTEVGQIHELRQRQPHAPLLVTEFWASAPLYWGNRIKRWPLAIDQARAVYEFTSAGAQVDFYMFEGGTNFGFWGGNNIAATYAAAYPVGDGGRLQEKYYAVHPASLFVSSFGDAIAGSLEVPDCGGVSFPEGVRLVVRSGGQGSIAYVCAAHGRGQIKLTLPGGKALHAPLGEVPATVLPLGLLLACGATVDYSNLCLLAQDARRKALLLYGPAGSDGVVSVNGQEAHVPVRRGAVERREVAGVNVIVTDERMAQRCWFAEDDILFGPDYVGAREPGGAWQIQTSAATPGVFGLDEASRPVALPFTPAMAEASKPQLSQWTVAPCLQAGSSGGWQQLDAPCSHERLGVTQGYLWYSAEYRSDSDKVETLLLPNTPNRVLVFVNGRYCGAHAERRSERMRDEYGHPADWAFEELAVRLGRGLNRFTFLSDDLGHNYDVPVAVGIQGPAFLGSRRLDIVEHKLTEPLPVSADGACFLHCRDYRRPEPLPALEMEVPRSDEETAFIVIHGVHAWVTVGGQDVLPMTWPESPWTMFQQIKRWITWQLPEAGPEEKYTVRIQSPLWRPEDVMEHMAVYTVPKAGALHRWRWRKWGYGAEAVPAQNISGLENGQTGPLVLLPVKSGLMRKCRLLSPAWFEAEFPMPEGDQPVYFNPGEMSKGQIFLNGLNVSRFWQKGGGRHRYYLPRAWMKEINKLSVFEELGIMPQGAELTL